MKEFVTMGLVHAMAFPRAAQDKQYYLQTLERILEDPYFNLVEIIPPFDDEMAARVAEMVRGSDADWVYCATPAQYDNQLDLNSADAGERKRAVDGVRHEIEAAAKLGIKKVQICSGKQVAAIRDRHAARERLIETLLELCGHAEKADVRLVLEIFDPDIEKRRLLGASIDAAYVAKQVRRDYDNFGLLQDLSHIPLMYENAYSAVETTKDYLVHTHIGNCVMRDRTHLRYGDTHPIFGMEGSEVGVGQLREFLEALFAVGYFAPGKRACMSFEIKPFPGESPEDYIKQAKQMLDEAWKTMNR